MTFHIDSGRILMDDHLGEPSFPPPREQDGDNEEERSEGEDEGPDWTTLP